MRTQYMFPLKCDQLIDSVKLPKIETYVSVRNHILLLIMTSEGEYHFDPDYGSQLWESDFDVCVTESAWASEMQTSLTQTIKTHESRIKDNFKVDVRLDKSFSDDNPNEIRQKFVIHISNMILEETNETIYDVEHTVIFSPLNID